MPKAIAAFGEDSAHREIIGSLITRAAEKWNIPVKVEWRNARGGRGKVIGELKEYFRDLGIQGGLPDLIVIATDANRKGLNERAREIRTASSPVASVLAIPDPHVERWLLLDGAAFKTVFGEGCQAPDQKCDRGRYKQALIQAIRRAGIEPALGGVEFAQEIIEAMDLLRAESADASLKRFLDDLRWALQGADPDRHP